MNLWLRLIWCLITARFRSRISVPEEEGQLRLRVNLFDLDVSKHMNNGRYLTVMDLGRLDMMLRTGLWRAVRANRWGPIASAVMVRFRRELKLGQAFIIKTRILWWEERSIIIEQSIVIDGGPRDGQIAAHAIFKGGIYDFKTKAFVPVERLMEVVGVSAESPLPDPHIAAFLDAEEEMRQSL